MRGGSNVPRRDHSSAAITDSPKYKSRSNAVCIGFIGDRCNVEDREKCLYFRIRIIFRWKFTQSCRFMSIRTRYFYRCFRAILFSLKMCVRAKYFDVSTYL